MGERVTRNQMTTVPRSQRYISNHTITSLSVGVTLRTQALEKLHYNLAD